MYICATYIPESLIYAVLPYLGHSDIFCVYLSNSLYLLKKVVKSNTGKESSMYILIVSPRPNFVYINR